MSSVVTIALQIISFLVANKGALKQLVLDLEGLIPDAPGGTKAAQVKTFIAASMGIEAQIEAVWPMVAPLFNAFVAIVKGTPAAPPAP